ncbi:tRNA (cytidine(34)-2'-O)-methyltransferase [Pelistega sp. NLN82]|uniref:tRNA (cytidine(34)-2'-O)-methyltransferase n=1 Tax=Pelistega ratti TaxID=2652177 RepID=A0A6L9Y4Z1_9BURK|nr:tRNA (cytidine(34)-2'-O)-methyltransferase [Pelistega ratti]NEN74868.1 tRNA (cytidine(34)-2'-O)-methyltransferase [Pelistega ratti]
MFHIILVSPEMPANTGNIIRLSANTGVQLHLVRPFIFSLDDKRLRRAGLDYHEYATLKVHDSLPEAIASTGAANHRVFAISTKGQKRIGEIPFQKGDCFIFGRETAGLKPEEWDIIGRDAAIRLPMQANSRSLNLSNAVAITIYDAWRQINFEGAV